MSLWESLEISSKIKRPKKNLIALLLIAVFAMVIFTIPSALGKDISLALSMSAFILVSVYVILSFEIIHRTSIALLGAIIIVAIALILGSITATESFEFIIDAIYFNTIGLLLGMMIIVAILAESGVFQWVGIKASKMIGDPPNIMIGSAANIDFNAFIVHMGPAVAVTFGVSLLLIKMFFRKDLKATATNLQQVLQQDENALLKDKTVLKKSLIVLFSIIAIFAIHGSLHLEVSVIALGGAAVLLVITRVHPEKVLHDVDWTTLIFFTGLFIIVGTAEHAGLIELLSSAAIGITGANPWLTFIMIIWLAAIASAFVDNIPFTATMIPLIQMLNANMSIGSAFGDIHISPLWWALALGADFGGNGTLIGSSAGVVAAGMSEKQGYPIGFNRWFKVGFPFTIITVSVGTIVLVIEIVFRI